MFVCHGCLFLFPANYFSRSLIFELFSQEYLVRSVWFFTVSMLSDATRHTSNLFKNFDSTMSSTLTVHCRAEDHAVRERAGCPPSFIKARENGR